MIIEKIRNKNGVVKTNIEICREAYAILRDMRDGTPDMNDKEKRDAMNTFYKICGDSNVVADEVMKWLEYVCEEKDDRLAQRRIEDTLRPVSAIRR